MRTWLICCVLTLAPAALPQDAVQLLPPRTAFRVLDGATATFRFVLATPPDRIEIDVVDGKGGTAARLHPDALQPGLNGMEWDLRYEPPHLVALRTTPPENPHIWEDARFRGEPTRPVIHKNVEEGQLGPLAAPGRYTVRLVVDGRPYSQPLDIALPPNSHGTDADVQAAVKLQLRLRDAISAAAGVVNEIEWLRKQIEDQRRSGDKSMDVLDGKLQAVEFQIISHTDALSEDKTDAETPQLYMKLLLLQTSLGAGTGKYAGGGDYAPTETSIGLVRGLESELSSVRARFQALMDKDVAAAKGLTAAIPEK